MINTAFTDLMRWLALAVIILTSIVGLLRFRQLPPSLRYLALLAGFDALLEVFSNWLIEGLHLQSNLFLIPVSAIGEVGLLLLAYREELQSAAFTRALPWVFGAFSAYVLLDSLAGLGTIHYAPGVQVLTDLLMMGLAGLYFQKLLNELRVERLRQEPFFWVSVGLVIYALGDLQISLFSNYLLTHYSRQLQFFVLWGVRALFLLMLYSSYCLALWMRPQK